MSNPTVLTVILNYRTPDLAVQAAEAALLAMSDLAGEIVIVDNDSQDGSIDIITKASAEKGWDRGGRIRVCSSGRNGGFGAGNNFGIHTGLSTGEQPDYVFLLNSDAWPEPGAIKALVDFLEAHPEAGMAGSYVEGPDGEAHHSAFRFPSIASEFLTQARTGFVTKLLEDSVVWMPIPEITSEADWVVGAAVLMRREMLDEIGLFDETYFLYFEEVDLCRRARQAGWEIWFVRESHVTHISGASTGATGWKRLPQYWFDSRLYYFAKNHGSGYAALATLASLSGYSIWALRQLVTGKVQIDPDHFIRDLIRHSWRAMVSRRARPAPHIPPMAIVEEQK